jgi:hypothetical protein
MLIHRKKKNILLFTIQILTRIVARLEWVADIARKASTHCHVVSDVTFFVVTASSVAWIHAVIITASTVSRTVRVICELNS